jgi:hypothetical protein
VVATEVAKKLKLFVHIEKYNTDPDQPRLALRCKGSWIENSCYKGSSGSGEFSLISNSQREKCLVRVQSQLAGLYIQGGLNSLLSRARDQKCGYGNRLSMAIPSHGCGGGLERATGG